MQESTFLPTLSLKWNVQLISPTVSGERYTAARSAMSSASGSACAAASGDNIRLTLSVGSTSISKRKSDLFTATGTVNIAKACTVVSEWSVAWVYDVHWRPVG